MPPADTATAHSRPLVHTPAATPATVHGWGGARLASVLSVRPRSVQEAAAAVDAAPRLADPAVGAIARGMGRAYNDAAQRRGGLVLDTTALKGFELDAESGVVTAQAGVTLGELMEALVPRGWMVPVVPGTQHVTVGGAIASDIHGKNHGVDGTFGAHVHALGLLTAAGEVLELSPARRRVRCHARGHGTHRPHRVGADQDAPGVQPAVGRRHRPRRGPRCRAGRTAGARRSPPGRLARSARPPRRAAEW